MAFPGLIRSFDFFFLKPGNKSIWSAILSQALYPPEVVNVVGLLAPDDWGGGGPTVSGFPAGPPESVQDGTSSAEVLPSPSLSATRSLGQPWPAPLPQPTQAAPLVPQAFPMAKNSRANPSSQRPDPTDCLSPADPPARTNAHCSSYLRCPASATCFHHQLRS